MALLDRTPPRGRGWATTRWSVVRAIGDRSSAAWQASWKHLVETYRAAMEGYVRRLVPALRANDAEDVVQSFLTACVEKDWLSRADPHRGRFRDFVRIALKRHALQDLRKASAQRRRPSEGHAVIPLPEDDCLPATAAADAAFDRDWVQTAVSHALARVEAERTTYRVILSDLIATDGRGSPDLAARLSVTPDHLRVLKFRARSLFARLFREELAATVTDSLALTEEWRILAPYLP